AILEPLAILMAPFGPHIAEELWGHLGNHENMTTIQEAQFPDLVEEYLVEDSVTYPISINGKKRGTADFPSTATKEELEKSALELEITKKWTEGKTVRKVIVVPNRMINVVVG
ncbi:MAG: class I tRNA ligase family protein, partial [Saprospiraceae bacterium]|nr:class I tRNA ligase family protein [Saprospiraceae bacterium]